MGTFTLDTSTLGGDDLQFTETPIEERGRSIQLTYSQSAAATDVELYGFAVRYAPAEGAAVEAS